MSMEDKATPTQGARLTGKHCMSSNQREPPLSRVASVKAHHHKMLESASAAEIKIQPKRS